MSKTTGRISGEEPKYKPNLDSKDITILKILSENSRIPLSKISSKVNLSRDAVDYRIKQLIKKCIILKFLPILSTRKLGYNSFHVFFLLDERDQNKKENFIQELKKNPNVRSVIEYSDRWDIEALFLARNAIEFDTILTEFTSNHSDIVTDKIKLEVIHYYKSILHPQDMLKSNIEQRQINASYDIDEDDIKIISILSENARESTYKIGEKLNMSPDKVAYRIKKMYNSGFIENFGIILNLNTLNYGWHTYAIQLKVLDKKNEIKFKEYVKHNPHIIRAVKVLGRWDILLYILVNNMRDLHKTIKEIKIEFSDIINTYETWSAYQEHTYKHVPEAIQSHLKKKKVLVFGTFDILHPGHISLFKEAKKYGDHLTVVVARDSTVRKVKGKQPLYDEKDRLEHVRQISFVDEAVLGNKRDKYEILDEVKPDVICLGYDQLTFTDKLEKKLAELKLNSQIVRMRPYKEKKYKSSKMRG